MGVLCTNNCFEITLLSVCARMFAKLLIQIKVNINETRYAIFLYNIARHQPGFTSVQQSIADFHFIVTVNRNAEMNGNIICHLTCNKLESV